MNKDLEFLKKLQKPRGKAYRDIDFIIDIDESEISNLYVENKISPDLSNKLFNEFIKKRK